MDTYRISYSILRALLSKEDGDTRDASSYLTNMSFSPYAYPQNISENILKFSISNTELWLKWVGEGGRSMIFLQKSRMKLFSGSQLRYLKSRWIPSPERVNTYSFVYEFLACTSVFSMFMNISTFRSIRDGFCRSNLRLSRKMIQKY